MAEPKSCPKCGAELPHNAPAGICPMCLMQAGLADNSDPDASKPQVSPATASSGFVPPDPADLAKLFPQLEILELVGQGGMGAVYKARQPGLDRLVAVKILPREIGHDAAFAERFTREARALARLSHNHIVSVYDFGQADGLFFILMEYVDGVNLRETMQSGGLSPQQVLAIVPQICEALQFAHDEGIVHRDIKPENILIDKRGRVKIADFGLAKLLASGDHSLTATHQVMGTLRYMAPEQMQGSREVDHRADIYSLGVVFYELLTGGLPLGKFAPPSQKVQIDVRLDEVVLRALEQDPEQRYQHASEVKTDVEAVASGKDATERGTRAGGNQTTVEDRLVETRRFPRWLLWSPLDLLRANVLENVTAVAVAISFALAAVKGICELAQRPSPLDVVAVPVTALAALAVGVLLVAHQFREPSGPRAALPGFCIAVLAVCAGSLPWTAVFSPMAGWLFWQGAVFASLNFLLGLGLLIAGEARPQARAISLLLVGLIGFGLVMAFDIGPVGVIGSNFLGTITRKPGLPGEFVAAALGLLAMIAGALQLRQVLSSPATNSEPTPFADSGRATQRSSRLETPDRPALVVVFATLDLIAAVALMLLFTAGDHVLIPASESWLWHVWGISEVVLGLLGSAGLFAASLALFLWKPWSRRLMLGVCFFGLAALVIDLPYLAQVAIPAAFEEIRQLEIAKGSNTVDADRAASFGVTIGFGGLFVVGLSWLIGHLVYFTRPRVIAAFEATLVARPESARCVATGPRLVQGPGDCLLLAAGMAFVTACEAAIRLTLSLV